MMLDRELDAPSDGQSISSNDRSKTRGAALRNAATFALFLAVTLLLQAMSGAYHSEFDGYPDESAHYVTSLMVRQYITSPNPGSPVQFARDYYTHYPKVAFGHWPPVLYIVQALWMSFFSAARASVLIQLAFTTAILAFAVYCEARRWLSQIDAPFENFASICLGLLTISLPIVQRHTDEEMSETLLTLLCFWSVIYFVRYLDSGRWQESCLFGVFFALAVLTKGSGWLLTLVPPIALLLTRKISWLRRSSFWIAALLVAITCVPWQLMTMHLVEEGWEGGSHPSFAYTVDALNGFAGVLVQIIGPALLLLFGVGIAVLVIIPLFKGAVPSGPAVMFSLIISDWLFHSLVPAGVEDRKMIIAVPAIMLFVLYGVVWVADHLPVAVTRRQWRVATVALAFGLVFCFQTFAIPHERHYGYIEAARYITSDPKLRRETVLVSSKSGGEGPFVAEVAMDEPNPTGTVLRATKALAYVSFDADVYKQLFPNAQSVLQFLRQRHVSLLVLDTFPSQTSFPHDRFLKQLVGQASYFRLLSVFPQGSSASSGQVQIYQLINSR